MGGFGQLGNQEEPQYRYRKGLLSQGSNSIAMKSRVNREVQARIRERLVVRFHWPTRQAFETEAVFRGLKAPAPSVLPELDSAGFVHRGSESRWGTVSLVHQLWHIEQLSSAGTGATDLQTQKSPA
jgi:hypothetical protein